MNKTKTNHRSYLLGVLLAAGSAAALANSQAQMPINLGSTAKFAVLAGSLVSNIPGSAITGDIGLSPAGGSKITGFGANEVIGIVYTVDATGPAGSVAAASDLTTAKGDLTIAYAEAAGRTPVPTGKFLNPGAGNLGGSTLEPGLYKFTSAASITGSDLTLSGDSDDVWIFQIASELIVGNGIKVILAGGALPRNIFWQVGTSATLGTTSVFKGTIMADQSISMNTGATLDGRAMARIAAVTLASSTVTRPASAPTAIKFGSAGEGAFLQVIQNHSERMATLLFRSPSKGRVTLRLMNARGIQVATLFEGKTAAGGMNQVRFSTDGMAKGIHFSRLEIDGVAQVAKALLLI